VDDAPLDLDAAVGDRPVLIMFFQGGWSPSSNAALVALQAMLPLFASLAVEVVAVTPELPRHAHETMKRNALTFTVAVDHACRFARNLRLVCKIPDDVRRLMRAEGLRIREWNGEGSYDVPMPTLLLLDGRRRVLSAAWQAVATDLDPGGMLEALRSEDVTEGDGRMPGDPAARTRTARRSAAARRGGR